MLDCVNGQLMAVNGPCALEDNGTSVVLRIRPQPQARFELARKAAEATIGMAR